MDKKLTLVLLIITFSIMISTGESASLSRPNHEDRVHFRVHLKYYLVLLRSYIDEYLNPFFNVAIVCLIIVWITCKLCEFTVKSFNYTFGLFGLFLKKLQKADHKSSDHKSSEQHQSNQTELQIKNLKFNQISSTSDHQVTTSYTPSLTLEIIDHSSLLN